MGDFMEKFVYLINSIEDYGKFISFCINKDVNVFRTYWDERETGNRCYNIDWVENRCYYADKSFYINEGYTICEPEFVVDSYGNYQMATKRVIESK